MSQEINQSNTASNISLDPEVVNNVGETDLESASQSEDKDASEVSLRELWSRQLAKQEEKVAKPSPNPGGNLAQTRLVRINAPNQLASWFK